MKLHTLIISGLMVFGIAVGCSFDSKEDDDDDDSSSAIADPSYADVSGIVSTNCATSGCHDGGTAARSDLSTEGGLNGNKNGSITRLNNNTMPPSGSMNSDDKTTLLNYLNNL